MLKEAALSIALTVCILCIGLSGCRSSQQAYGRGPIQQPGFSSGQMFPQANQFGRRVGNIAVNRGINAAITRVISGL